MPFPLSIGWEWLRWTRACALKAFSCGWASALLSMSVSVSVFLSVSISASSVMVCSFGVPNDWRHLVMLLFPLSLPSFTSHTPDQDPLLIIIITGLHQALPSSTMFMVHHQHHHCHLPPPSLCCPHDSLDSLDLFALSIPDSSAMFGSAPGAPQPLVQDDTA